MAVSLVGIAVSVFLFFANPLMTPFEEYHLINIAALLWLPILVSILFLKIPTAEMGLSAGSRREGLKWTFIGLLIMLPIIAIAAQNPNIYNYYIARLRQPLAIANWISIRPGLSFSAVSFCYYEIVMGVYFFCWEFFFRGFLLFGLARTPKIGIWGAIALQTIPFTLLHWSLSQSASKPISEIMSAAVGGLLLGYIAARTRSFLYGFLIHWIMALSMDAFIVFASIHKI